MDDFEMVIELEYLKDKMEQIQAWIDAYPLAVFPEPDFAKAAAVLKEHDMALDAISASNMRHVLRGIAAIINSPPGGRSGPGG